MTLVDLIDEVLAVQGLRAVAYRELALALRSNDTNAVERTTDSFRQLSRRVLDVIDVCDDGNDTMGMLRATLREMQAHESDKLRLTIEIHALRSSHILEEEDAAVGAEPTCGCGSREGPTKYDVEEALREAYVAMEECVQQILGCMEELREMRGELKVGSFVVT